MRLIVITIVLAVSLHPPFPLPSPPGQRHSPESGRPSAEAEADGPGGNAEAGEFRLASKTGCAITGRGAFNNADEKLQQD
jgi:hypothetical protein